MAVTHDEAFLADIIEHPDDDGLRLVYADWLDDHGQPERAEFIRVQVGLATLPKGDPRREGLRARERLLLATHQSAWLGPLRPWINNWRFRRGLVEAATLKVQTLLRQADTLFRLAPLLQLTLTKSEGHGPDLAGCPHLARLASLRAYGLHTIDSLALVASPHLSRLTSLGLPEASLCDPGVRALAESPLLARLTELDLTCNGFGDAGVEALASSPNASRLERLDISRNRIGNAGASALAGSRHLGRLRSLRLSRIWRGERGMDILQARFGNRVHFD
jgi:uncharacterized protein (TIGR02996 family)